MIAATDSPHGGDSSEAATTGRRRRAFTRTGRGRRPSEAGAAPFEAGELLATASELERLVQLSVDMLCVSTMSGRFVVVNPAWSATLGWTEQELLGAEAIDFVHPADRARTLEHASRLAEPGAEVRDFENRLVHRDGSVRWFVWNARSDGNRIYAVARNVTPHKRAEAAAREAQQLFRGVFAEAPIGMAVWLLDRDREFRPIEVNRAMCEIIGHPAERLLEIRPRDLVHPDDVDVGRGEVLALLRGEVPSCSLEKRFVRGDGSVIWAQVRLSIARDAAGQPLYGICQFQDVTDRREAHESLRASEQRLRKLVQTAHEGIWMLDPDNRVAFVNGRLAEMLGYRVDELLGRPVSDFLSEQGRALARTRMDGRRHGVADSQELRLIRKDGGEVWVILSGSPLVDELGEYGGAIEMLVEITDRRQREQALRASEERYRNIVETTSEGVWMIDADHRTTYVNRRMAQMLGYTVEEMLGRPVTDFTSPARRSHLQLGAAGQREVLYRRRDGSEMWALLSGSPLTDGKGGYGGALAMVSDITERKRVEEAATRLAAIVESAPDAIFSTDLDGRITSFNAAAERLYGYARDEAIGMDVRRMAGPETRERVGPTLARLRRGESIGTVRSTARHRDGTLFEIEPTLSAISSPAGGVLGTLAIVRIAS